MTNRRAFTLGAAALALAGSQRVNAQEAAFPARPIRVVFPYAAGGGPDSMLRVICKKVETLNPGVTLLVENRPGAGGTIGTTQVKQSDADGYTIMLGSHSTHATNPALYKNLHYDPITDFEPVTLLYQSRTFLIVPTSVGVNSVKELYELAKRKPNGLVFASPGIGSGGHLGGVMLGKAFRVQATHVPYKGSGHARADVLAGRVDFMFNSVQPFMGDMENGTVKVLAVADHERFSELPNIPTMAETGYPDIEIHNWFGLFAPHATPRPVLDKLNAMFVAAGQTPEVRDFVLKQGFVASVNSRPAFADFVKRQVDRLGRIVREENITL